MMNQPQAATLPVINKRYVLNYKNEYDQAQTVECTLLHLDLNGFVAFDVQGKMLLLPKDRLLLLREL